MFVIGTFVVLTSVILPTYVPTAVDGTLIVTLKIALLLFRTNKFVVFRVIQSPISTPCVSVMFDLVMLSVTFAVVFLLCTVKVVVLDLPANIFGTYHSWSAKVPFVSAL